ncbi:NAD-dependent epimerase/dehydratase family protein [Nonomuraea endophytica]|uniref:Nucleoside-diphosphate-sugar epimerase n=1 Tax=Nonomuraea endophytica TaxID=714136 RepID=A0A7W8EI06_9ACTN|nr:NAD-dependent epimerase/dehydratase family protein [Nonomuraea endophytica]MBB5081490.1 nucleoside-diphosphate-sugar epimerase [Nonomuraea endophytica]
MLMKAMVFGATGMVGQGVLRECPRDNRVTEVLVIGRAPTGITHPKLREIVHGDLAELMTRAGADDELSGYDACFFCLGVSSAGMAEEAYTRITHDLALTVARALSAVNPDLTFVHVSGQGADSSEQGRSCGPGSGAGPRTTCSRCRCARTSSAPNTSSRRTASPPEPADTLSCTR